MKQVVSVAALVVILVVASNAYADPCSLAERLVERAMEERFSDEGRLDLLQKAQELCPTLGWAFSQEARIWADNDDPVQARKLIKTALEKSPDDSRVLKDALHVWRIIGDAKKASKILPQVMSEYPTDLEVLLDAALVHKALGRKSEAEMLLRTCSDMDSNLGHCDFELGKLYLERGRTTIAEDFFARASNKNSVLYTAYVIENEISKYKRKKYAFYAGVAVGTVLVLLILLWFIARRRGVKVRDLASRKRTDKNVQVKIKVLPLEKDGDGLDIAAKRYTVQVETAEDGYVAMFAITSLGGLVPLNTGSHVEVFPINAGEKIEGSIFLKLRGQIAHCFAVASKAKFSFEDHVMPYIAETISKPITDSYPEVLPLPQKYFGQSHVKIKNQ